MSTPTPPIPAPGNSDCVKREDWDKCIRDGTWRVAVGILFGAIGSAVLVSEVPMMVGAGLGIGWAVRHCKNLLNVHPKPLDSNRVDDPCACCHSDFEALDKNEFDHKQPPPTATNPTSPPTGQATPTRSSEEKCTCNEMATSWSPPKPVEPPYSHPPGCSCYN